MKKLVVVLFLILANTLVAQNINDYKYASIPAKFGAVKKKELNRLYTIAKLYMQRYGFEAYMESEQAPFEFSNSNCNKVFVDLVEDNTLFSTKIAVVIKDCKGTVLATSPFGKSREKDLVVAYDLALRQAFDNFVQIKSYKYNGKVITDTQVPAVATSSVVAPAKPSSDLQVIHPDQLYAQSIPNGFQLVNSEPRVVYKIFKTSNNDIYAAVKGDISGVFIPKGNEWFFEYYKNDKLISEKVNVKF